jgi:FMN phosphatase YigB (HAD superfamily)
MKYRGVLFDLDGTLLPLNLESFIQDYFRALAASVAEHVEPRRFIFSLLQATQVMLENDGSKTNSQAFMEHFFPLLNCQPHTLLPLLNSFTRKNSPTLVRGFNPCPRLARRWRRL